MANHNVALKDYEVIFDNLRTQLESFAKKTHSPEIFLNAIASFMKENLAVSAKLLDDFAPFSSLSFYADIEATAKTLRSQQVEQSTHIIDYPTVSNIQKDDEKSARIYVVEKLSVALSNALFELPMNFRAVYFMLEAVQLLLANILVQKVPTDIAQMFMNDLYQSIHNLLEKENRKADKKIN